MDSLEHVWSIQYGHIIWLMLYGHFKIGKSSGISVRIYQENRMSNDIATTNLFPGGLSGLTYWRLGLIALDKLH